MAHILIPLIPGFDSHTHLIPAQGTWIQEGIWLGGVRNILWERTEAHGILSEYSWRQELAHLILRI